LAIITTLTAITALKKENDAYDKFMPQNNSNNSYCQQIFLEDLKSFFNKTVCT